MKTNYILIGLALCFYLNTTAQMANSKGGDDPWENLQNTFNESFPKDDSDELNKLSRWNRLRQSDIRLKMIVKNENKGRRRLDKPNDTIGGDGFYEYKYGDDELIVEFDWDNLALSMKGTSAATEYYDGQKAMGGDRIFKEGGDTVVQYTDKDGNWYAPVENMEGYEDIEFIRFNPKTELLAVADILDSIDINKLAFLLSGYLKTLDLNDADLGFKLSEDFGLNIAKLLIDGHANLQEELEKALKTLLKDNFSKIGGFPIFIHWAFLYSPEYVKSKERVTESKVTFAGNPNCTKLIVTSSGENKGKSMIFDEYDRLVFINSLKEGTAQFFYDRDITVTLPDPKVVMDMSEIFGGFSKKEDENNTKESSDEIKKAIEEAKRKSVIERLRKEELAKLEAQLKEAVTPQEREEIQQKIKELKELMEKESN
ncbi:MAG: hypothetical protein R2785_05255 [Flavobacteriaceae bacterium]